MARFEVETLAVEPDILIVGGGTAGCVLAARLSANPDRSVVLLEAGRDLSSPNELPPVLVGHPPATVLELPDTWRYDAELTESPPRRMGQFRGRILGGSSSINGSLFVRGVPEDYDAWGSSLWCFDQVLPYFRKLETDLDFQDEFHGSDGPLSVSRSLRTPLTASQHSLYETAVRAGYAEKPDLNHPVGGGIGRVPMTSSGRSTALTYLGPCRTRPNLTVVPHAVARRVIFEGHTAVGVEVLRDGRRSVVRAREIILSAGTFGSAQLLLASGVGPADQLRAMDVPCVADRAGVGQNLRCHPMVSLRVPTRLSGAPDPDMPRLVLVHSVSDRNNVMIFPRQMADGLAIMVTLRLPSSSGQMRLRSSDPLVPPAISYGYLEPSDLRKLREGLQLACDLAELRPGSEAAAVSDAWILQHMETADHACGTCKLGVADDPRAAVDEWCRVVGVNALRVVDLSIVPQPVRAGPYPTVVMLAERAADLINIS
jgi:choline dehydrogenase